VAPDLVLDLVPGTLRYGDPEGAELLALLVQRLAEEVGPWVGRADVPPDGASRHESSVTAPHERIVNREWPRGERRMTRSWQEN
jgi:hypothetical protein